MPLSEVGPFVFEAIPIVTVPLLPLLGVVLYLALQHVLLAGRSGPESPHVGVALLCLLSGVFLLGRLIQLWTATEAGAILGIQIQYAGLFCMGSALLLMPQRKTPRWLAIGPIAATVFLFATKLFVPGVTFARVSALEVPYFAVKNGPLTLVLMPLCVWIGVSWLRASHQREAWATWPRWVWYVIIGVCSLMTIHDVGMNQGLYRSIHLLEYGIVGVSVGVSLLSTRKLRARVKNLEELVSKRTHGLESAVDGLMASEARYRQLADTTFEGILVAQDGCIVDVNLALTTLVGRSPGFLYGTKASALLAQPSPEVLAVASGESQGPVEAVAKHEDGSTFPVELVSRSQDDSLVLAMRDISERREMQARLLVADRMVSMGTLAAGVAHEINNPLTYVMTNLQVAQELARTKPLPAESVGECLVDAIDGCTRVRSIVEDLRQLSRPVDADVRVHSVQEILDRCLHMAENEVRHRARIIRRYSKVPRVLCSEGRLSQVLLNLLLNAAQAMPVGSANEMALTLTLESRADGVVIEIRDTGSGIPPEVLPRVFDPFFTTKSPGVGTGLGLSICHTLVTQMGGDIQVESCVGEGTTVRVILPAADDDAAAQTAGHSTAPPRSVSRARVLVVDDEPTVGRALKRALNEHDVSVAKSGRAALGVCFEQKFDLVLCDLMMPEMTGMEFFEALQTRDPDLCDRIVFMTGGAFTKEAKDFLDSAGRPSIGKPFDLHRLRSVVAELLPGERAAPPKLTLVPGGSA